MSNEQKVAGLASDLNRELEPSAEELLRLLLEQFFVDWKGELEWSNREGITLANQIGKDKERLFAKYLTSPNKQDYAALYRFWRKW